MAMDLSELTPLSSTASGKEAAYTSVTSFGSDPDSEFDDALVAAALPRVNGAVSHPQDLSDDGSTNGDDDADDDDDEDDEEGSEVSVESLFDDTIQELDDLLHEEDPEGYTYEKVTPEEGLALRKKLRDIGPTEFCNVTIESGAITAKKLLTAFNIRPPPYLEGAPDEAYYSLLSLAISRELSKRIKLPHWNSIDDAVDLIKKSRNIIVLTGAGISTSLGIPDFRSKDIGLYSKLEHLGLSDPQEVFDIELFRQDPTIFYSVARDILPDTERTTPTHAFIYLLQQKGKLLTNYSQNIDNIESTAGILPEKLIQCHGSFATASCIQCKYNVPGELIFPDIRAGRIPRCDRCIAALRQLKAPAAMKRKRSQNGQDKKKRRFDTNSDSEEEEDYDIPAAGVMKPDITFFGEALPDKFSERLTNHDKDKVDLVIVIGTSLKVAPVSEVVPYLPSDIPQIYISRETVSHVNFDIDMLGDCDIVVSEICRRAGWDLRHPMIPKDQVVNVVCQDPENAPHRHRFHEIKKE
ncbi:DHS-like NAD/FAD-binding domain-containing protein [Tricladium varicosporioides]|nr:DHS-like NAD/FAD-binding domain-containing protein [Hymenoscyphus varicosporioides]